MKLIETLLQYTQYICRLASIEESWITRGGGQGWAGWRTDKRFTGCKTTKDIENTFTRSYYRGQWARDQMEGIGEMVWLDSGTSYTGSWKRQDIIQ